MNSYSINIFFRIAFAQIIKRVKAIFLILFIFIATSSFSQIKEVGGILAEDETWTKEFTYIVIQDLFVNNEATLTIEAGVNVKIKLNRGIVIEKGGNLLVNGTATDSVRFMPDGQNFKWKGLVITDADTLHKVQISHACFLDAETAIKIITSQNVKIENTCVFKSQNVGVHFVNSSFCLLSNSEIENNYDGVRIFAGLFSKSSNNEISNCIIRNQNHNIFIHREEGGICRNNVISSNLIEGGNNGIWVLNNGGIVSSGNIIQFNKIINNGNQVGYGLYLSQDSSLVKNNIFWGNNIGLITETGGNNSTFSNNSFYQNNEAIVVGQGSESNNYFNNTFALNTNALLKIEETNGTMIRKNNFMNTLGMEHIVVNNQANNIPMAFNYWDAFSSTEIEKLIYDKLENPDLGKIIYEPYLSKIDTSNPVAPPYHSIQQIIDGKIQISWNPNKEADLKGYRVYYGKYSNYSFTSQYENNTDTSIIFSSGVSLYDTVAVTAFDIGGVISNEQLSGHESPFAFAVVYPYAGNDTLICGVEEYEIKNANIPFEYQYIFWSTSGDGLFKNPYSISPTYIPGLNDDENGGAYVSLNVVTENDLFTDVFHLLIKEKLIVFAGNDTVVLAEEELLLANAFAKNYDKLMWVSSGDGSFNNDTIENPIYYSGPIDIEKGFVFLEMIIYSDCGYISDTIKVNIAPYFSVKGKLWAGDEYSEPAIVVAYKEDNTDVRAAQTAIVASDGTYSFQKLPTANYYLYAIPDTNNADNLVPCYYANKTRWQSAYLLKVDADVYGVDIKMPTVDYSLPNGEASISGHFVKPQKSSFSNIYCNPWFGGSNNEFCNGGISNVSILLFNYDKSKLLDYTLTDEFGNFYFSNLPYGNYVVDAEKAGLQTTASSLIQLSPEHKNEYGVLLEVNDKKIAITFKPQNVDEKEIAVFPNPATTEVNIPYSEEFSYQSEIIVYDHFGQLILETNLPENNTTGLIKLDIKIFKSGLYFGQIVNANKIAHFRFVKQ